MTQTLDASSPTYAAPTLPKEATESLESRSHPFKDQVKDQAVPGTDLGSVDRASFGAAQLAAAGDGHSDYLPALAVPVALDKGVAAEHNKLAVLADSQLSDPASRQKMHAAMDAFEHRADTQGLTPDQVSETYRQMERMLGPAPSSPLTAAQRQQAAGQWMDRLADPTGETRQGWHDTCGWTYLETRLLSRDPEKLTEKMAQVVTSGTVTTLDFGKVQKMLAQGQTPAEMPTKVLTLDSDSLKPDQEGQGLSPHADRRDYVDQLAQVMLDNLSWDAKMRTPQGQSVPAGAMQYNQCALIQRPGDPLPDGSRADKSCESVSYTDPKTQQRVVLDDNGYGFGGAASSTDLAMVSAIVSGRFEPTVLQRPGDGMLIDTNTAMPVDSVAELKTQLAALKNDGQYPFGVFVEVNHPGIREDYLARHTEKTSNQVPSESWHVIAVTGMDDQGNVQIFNPWGIKRTLTPEQLFEAMKKPA